MQNNNYICWQMDGLISRGVKTGGGGGGGFKVGFYSI